MTKVSWLFDELSDNNASDYRLSLAMSVAISKLVAYQINTCYNSYARDGAFHHINLGLCIVKSTIL